MAPNQEMIDMFVYTLNFFSNPNVCQLETTVKIIIVNNMTVNLFFVNLFLRNFELLKFYRHK